MGGSISSLPKFSDITSGIGSIVNPPPPPPKLTEAEVKEISTARDAFNKILKDTQENITYYKDKEIISPEAATEAFKIVSNENTWLINNPNANLLEIKAHSDGLRSKLDPIYELYRLRKILRNLCKYTKFVLSSSVPPPKGINPYVNNKGLSKALSLIADHEKWLSSNQSQDAATYTKEGLTLFQNIANALSITENDFRERFVGPAVNLSESKMDSLIGEVTVAQNLQEQQEFSIKRLTSTASGVAISVFGSLILTVIILFGGCLAANMAIGRTIYYRIFYFLFACLPWITPFVYVYAALLQLRGQGVTIYSMLPITTTPATTRLGKVLLLPFLYIQDGNIDDKTKEFIDSLDKMASVVLSRQPPSPGSGGTKCES